LYINAEHSITGGSPFMALHGWQPALTPSDVATNVPEANKLTQTLQSQWEEIAAALRQSKFCLMEGRTKEVPILFEIVEEAWLDAKMST
jgi:hypothetical protein